jgi:hypothetical protein
METYTSGQGIIINGKVSEKSLEEIMNKESRVLYNRLKMKKTEDFIDFFDSIKSIIVSNFKYDYSICQNHPQKNYETIKDSRIYGVCRHGTVFAKAIVESLAPELKTYSIETYIEKKDVYHSCLGILVEPEFFIFNAFSSTLDFGLIMNNNDLLKIGKMTEIINDEGEYLIDPIVSFHPRKEVKIRYTEKLLKLFESREKNVLWLKASLGIAKISSDYYD